MDLIALKKVFLKVIIWLFAIVNACITYGYKDPNEGLIRQ